tara:strand:- start:208 stop:588 length:381 start_codon:yes stop_codon:yes gene_type:complete
MPFADPEEQKEYFKRYNANRRWADTSEEFKEKARAKAREFTKTPAGKMKQIIDGWKRKGVINDDYKALYKVYFNTEFCDVCKVKFNGTKDRCLDHDHATGLFRQFLCQDCNRKDRWIQKLEEQKTW